MRLEFFCSALSAWLVLSTKIWHFLAQPLVKILCLRAEVLPKQADPLKHRPLEDLGRGNLGGGDRPLTPHPGAGLLRTEVLAEGEGPEAAPVLDVARGARQSRGNEREFWYRAWVRGFYQRAARPHAKTGLRDFAFRRAATRHRCPIARLTPCSPPCPKPSGGLWKLCVAWRSPFEAAHGHTDIQCAADVHMTHVTLCEVLALEARRIVLLCAKWLPNVRLNVCTTAPALDVEDFGV